MKVQADHLMPKTVRVQTDCLDIMMIVILLILSESLDFEKRDIEKELAFSEKIMNFFLSAALVLLMKNLFLTNLLMFCLLIFSVILMIQTSVFLRTLFSDFLKFLFLILTFSSSLNAVLVSLLVSLTD